MNSFIDALIFNKLEKYGHNVCKCSLLKNNFYSLCTYKCDRCRNVFGIKPGKERIFLIENDTLHSYGEKDSEIVCDDLIVKDIVE